MGKKLGQNPKAVEAKAAKEGKKAAHAAASAAADQDADWAAAGEGARSKAQKKREQQDAEREAAAAKKAEAKRLAAEEDAQLAAAAKKPAKAKVAAPKVTAHERQLQREAEAREQAAQAAAAASERSRTVDEASYSQQVEVQNINKGADDAADARSVEAALAALGVQEEALEDKHPEKRMKAAFAAYKEQQLPQLREEKPGLKQSQYQDMIFKSWQKSPQNPLVRAAQATSR